ncbi:MAG: DJ/PfpI family protein [Chthoniobacteraceae bacterium]|nr:DJ/PfpI family protein [Chthoniobacteraceae bacterium]
MLRKGFRLSDDVTRTSNRTPPMDRNRFSLTVSSAALCALIFFSTAFCLSGGAFGETPDEIKLTSAAAVAAQGRYQLVVDQAKKQMVIDLRAALKESMQAGQLEEANRISRIVDSQGENIAETLVSGHGKAAQARFSSTAQRATQDYVKALKGALTVSLRSAQLEESNRISAEIKKYEATAARQPDAATGFINLMPLIDPAKDTVAGKWILEKGTLISSGSGEERIEIPYQPPQEYDYRTTFTKTGSNCVIQILSESGTPFIWVMGASGSFTFHYLKGTGTGANKTTVQKPPGIKDNHRYTSLVRVRKNGVEALLDGKVITKWATDYSDAASEPFWALRDKNLLGLATGASKTVFHTIEVKEVSGPGKFQRQ